MGTKDYKITVFQKKKTNPAPTTARNQWGDLIKYNSWGTVVNTANTADSVGN